MSAPALLTLLGKPGCHLCEEMREVIEEVLPRWQAVLAEEDVRADPERARRYVYEIPVLLLGAEELARHRLTAGELEQRLAEHGVRRAP